MEFQRRRIPWQTDGDTVLRFDRQATGAAGARASHAHLLVGELNIAFARVFQHRLADIFFRPRAVRRLQRFVLDRVLELVVREIWWDEFEAEDGREYHQPDPENHFYGSHSVNAPPARVLTRL